ncbi:MAG: hypothetical protein WC147_06015 [Syntrophomonas sp.]|nr:hypothetical protein [Syntrophomonadaceae bacterium]
MDYITWDNIDEADTEVQERLTANCAEINQIIKESIHLLETEFQGRASFRFAHSAPGDILTTKERYQHICFVTKYESLPPFNGIKITKHKDKYYLGNLDYIRHILNEYRLVIQNKSDSIYYAKIHRFCRDKLMCKDPTKGLSISLLHETKGDISDVMVKMLDERNKAISLILRKLEFDYLYNGILQHSDIRYTKRFLTEYSNGELNYVFIKHVLLLDYIKDWLIWHYRIVNSMTFPKIGPL